VHILVSGTTGPVDSRTRAYVEYRVFDMLRSVEREIRKVDVALSGLSVDVPRVLKCTVFVEFTSGEQVAATATADWPYAAVDRAVTEAWTRLRARQREAMSS
jgi:ribosome-associated translation inhibitor RaiA